MTCLSTLDDNRPYSSTDGRLPGCSYNFSSLLGSGNSYIQIKAINIYIYIAFLYICGEEIFRI